MQADRLLGLEIANADGSREDRRHTVLVFNGPPPEIRTFPSETDESAAVGVWLRSLTSGGQPHEIGVFGRSLDRVVRGATRRAPRACRRES